MRLVLASTRSRESSNSWKIVLLVAVEDRMMLCKRLMEGLGDGRRQRMQAASEEVVKSRE